MFPDIDIDIHITYSAETKERRRALDIDKSHVNDAFVMGQFHPKHRSKPICYKKKRRNNRCLEKFYDAKYIDSRDGKKRSGQELFNGRISRNHKKDSENLHQYRLQKVTPGRRTIRRNITPFSLMTLSFITVIKLNFLKLKSQYRYQKLNYLNTLAVIPNQYLINRKGGSRRNVKPRIPPHPTAKQGILFLRRMGYPARKKDGFRRI